nr:MAG TPA: hypothetical protein [Caudoviricetes sp.]
MIKSILSLLNYFSSYTKYYSSYSAFVNLFR